MSQNGGRMENNFTIIKTSYMKKNMGNTDRAVRTLVAIALLSLSLGGIVTGVISTIVLVVAAIFLLTSLISFCPLYTILGINTCKISPRK